MSRRISAALTSVPLFAIPLPLKFLLAALLLGLMALAYPVRGQAPTVPYIGSVELHANHLNAAGIWSDGTTFWIGDADDDHIYAYTLSGTTLSHDSASSFDTHSNNGNPAGIAYDAVGDRILVADASYSLSSGGQNYRCYFAYGKSSKAITGGGTTGCTDQGLLPLAAQHPRGFADWGKNAWIVDNSDTEANPADIANDSAGDVQGIDLHADNDNPWGSWTDGRTLWVTDWTDTFIYAYSLHDGQRDTTKEFDLTANNTNPRGIWSDGTKMFVVDKRGNTDVSRVYKYMIEHLVDRPEAEETFDFAAAAADARGIAVSETRIYISDQDTDKIYVYDRSATPVRQTSEEFNLNASNGAPFGMWTDGVHLWVAQNNSTTVYAYRLSDRSYQSGENLSLDSNNDKPVSIWANADGSKWWAVDRTDTKVYGYQDGSHTSSLDFDLDAANDKPFGGWSDGVTAWVGDAEDDYMYAYWLLDGTRRPEKDIRVDPRNVDHRAMTSDGNRLYVLEKDEQTAYGYEIDTAPVLAVPLTDFVVLNEPGTKTKGIPSSAFKALDGDTLAYFAELTDKDDSVTDTLPAWLEFNETTGTFTIPRFPTTEKGKLFYIRVSATDGLDAVSDVFFFMINSQPEVDQGIPDQEIPLDTAYSYEVPSDAFVDADPKEFPWWCCLVHHATLADGSALPSWLSFSGPDSLPPWSVYPANPWRKTFTGTPTSSEEGALEIKVTVSDGFQRASDTFFLIAGNAAPEFKEGNTAIRRVHENTPAAENVGAPLVAEDRNPSDTLTYSIGGTDQNHFRVTNHGQIKTHGALNHEGKSTYTVTVTVTDSTATDTITVTIEVNDLNEPHSIVGDRTVDVAEGSTTVASYSITDPDRYSPSITWYVLGTDARFFRISSNGDVSFRNAPNYENAQDGGADNRYLITVRASEGTIHTVEREVTVRVTNVDEPGAVSFSNRPTAEVPVTASLTDPDGSVSGLTWKWQGPPGTDLTGNGANTATYTPQIADIGKTLRAVASYTDAIGSGKTAHKDSASGVLGSPAPEFPPGETGRRSIDENTATGQNIGAPVAATHRLNATLTYILGGADASRFSIDSADGQLKTRSALDHETKASYTVQVTATEPDLDTDTITVTITVNDVDEAGVVTFSPSQPQVGVPLTARLNDPDDGVTGETWAWQYDDGMSLTGNGADTAVYTPQTDDLGKILRAVVTYDDTFATGKTAQADTSAVIVRRRAPAPTNLGGGGGGGGGAPRKEEPSDEEFDWNVTHDLKKLDPDNDDPRGLWSDGETLWVLGSVFAYQLSDGERQKAREFELDRRNRFPHGIWSNGEIVWVADSGQDKLFAYNLESGERQEDLELDLDERNRDPRGIWSDGETFYVLDSVKDALFSYDRESGELVSEHALDKLNKSPRGIWSDGTRIWVSDDGAKRLFAYQVGDETLERKEEMEFGFRSLLKAGNGNPSGIWSNGNVMYVADERDARVYTYNMPDVIDDRLASLSLEGVDIVDFDQDVFEYVGEPSEDLTVTTVKAIPVQSRDVITIDPPDADEELDGHQLTLDEVDVITITVTSADGERTTVYAVQIEDPNRSPEGQTIPALQLIVGGDPGLVDLANWFSDPDGDPLSYEVGESSHPAVATVVFDDGKVTVTPVTAGEASFSVTATDGELASEIQSVAVTVNPAAETESEPMDEPEPDTVVEIVPLPDVRIAARQVDLGALEFAAQLREPEGSWQERILPRLRFVAPGVEQGRWLHSNAISVADGVREIRIAARRLESGRVEFALQVRSDGQDWGERLLPRARFMPADSDVGRWLNSSPISIE